ncbi:hypothetical protein E0Z10_g1081 [Xylaria hypoxylon]|uniref:Uncharacterized protein n=1 Tax=Xylaria hypoxylon TaxID=37992 RepID=A0A4Z0ZFT5_9PEZI|nr:hypothetical protein E0Z10_g1081 [Xylaria hypoxylon]
MPDSAPAVHFDSSVPLKRRAIDERSKLTGLPPAPITYATTARQTTVGILYADSTVKVPRAKSVLVNNKLSFPPVPTTSECPYCGVIVKFKGITEPIMWKAPSHDPIIFEREVKFQEHSRKEHSVSEAHVGTLSGAARRPVLEKILECPFGDDFSAPVKAGSNTVFSNEALYLHVAAHMKEIALLALQKLPSDDDDKPEDVTR